MPQTQSEQQNLHNNYLDPALFSGGLITASVLILTLIWQNIKNTARDIARESTEKATQNYTVALTDNLKELKNSIFTLNNSIGNLQESFIELDRRVEKNENQHPYEHQIISDELSRVKQSITDLKGDVQYVNENLTNLIELFNITNAENQFTMRKRNKS